MKRTRRGNGRPTIADVATQAGVGAITVSRALRNPEHVSPKLRAKIQSVIDAIGYVPDASARSLATNRSSVVGVIVPSLMSTAFGIFTDVVRGIYDGLEGADLKVQLANTDYSPAEEERLLAGFLGQRPAALIVTGIDQTPRARKLLESGGCPVVQIMDLTTDPVDMVVGFSHFAGGEAAARHLIGAGYRHIGFIGARMDPRSERRLAGFRAALAEAHMSDRLVTTTETPSSILLGRQMFRQLRERAPDVDAVFCNNDDLAMGVLFECLHLKLAVPQRIGIVGFNDLEIVEAAEPSLTSVRTPRYEIGRKAALVICDRLAGKEAGPAQADLGFEVIPRGSTQRRSPRKP